MLDIKLLITDLMTTMIFILSNLSDTSKIFELWATRSWVMMTSTGAKKT